MKAARFCLAMHKSVARFRGQRCQAPAKFGKSMCHSSCAFPVRALCVHSVSACPSLAVLINGMNGVLHKSGRVVLLCAQL